MIKVYQNSVEFIVPDKDRNGEVVGQTFVLKFLHESIGSIHLGMGQSYRHGIWITDEGEHMCERNSVLRVSFPDSMWPKIAGVIVRFAALGVKRLNQAELALYVNGTLTIVSTDIDENVEEEKSDVESRTQWAVIKRPAVSINDDDFYERHIKR